MIQIAATRSLSMTTLVAVMTLLCFSGSCSVVVAPNSAMVKNLPGYPGDLPFKLETGYIGVGDLERVQLFYYFVESEGSPKDDPLLLWLTGGPGCSSLTGLVYEIGPIQFDYSKSKGKRPVFRLNPNSWTKVANIIFVDSPVGTGFSYATSWTGVESTDTTTAALLHEFMRKWLQSHPQFLDNPLYISGDSYSGKIVPLVVEEIYDGNEAGLTPEMNLCGYVLGNPVTFEAKDISMRVRYAHLMALISDEIYQAAKKECHGDYMIVDPRNIACLNALQNVSICISKLDMAHILEPSCDYASPKPNTSRASPWNRSTIREDEIRVISSSPSSLPKHWWCRIYNYLYSYIWANDGTVQEALHVRKGSTEVWQRCNESLSYTKDVLSTVPYHYKLTKKSLRALIYSGDHDLSIPYIGTMEWIKSLNLTVSDSWAPWFVDGQIAGYSTVYGNTEVEYTLTFTTIKGGGHTAPEYKPKECFAMIDRWLAHFPL